MSRLLCTVHHIRFFFYARKRGEDSFVELSLSTLLVDSCCCLLSVQWKKTRKKERKWLRKKDIPLLFRCGKNVWMTLNGRPQSVLEVLIQARPLVEEIINDSRGCYLSFMKRIRRLITRKEWISICYLREILFERWRIAQRYLRRV